MTIHDKIAIVTGGGSGIGEAVSHELTRRGAALVVVADINAAAASRVAQAISDAGGRAEARQVDVSSESAVRRMVEETFAEHGRLDYLFNNAGIGIGGDARDLTAEHWRQVLGVDLFGVIYGTLAAYPIMTRQGFGHIVNTSSAAGLLPGPFNAPYNTSKHGVVGLSLSLRIEAADLGVKVSVVCPGFVRTGIYDSAVTVNLPADKANPSSRLQSRMMAAPASRADNPGWRGQEPGGNRIPGVDQDALARLPDHPRLVELAAHPAPTNAASRAAALPCRHRRSRAAVAGHGRGIGGRPGMTPTATPTAISAS